MPKHNNEPGGAFSTLTIRPQKRLGQNFLTNNGIRDKILNALSPHSDETIIEIGPGKGALTERLVQEAGRVVAIEYDRQLGQLLSDKFASAENFKLIAADALATDFCSVILPAQTARVVANLPYNISTAILQRLIEQRHCISEMVLMLQREVVERITAPPGSTDRGGLTVLVETYTDAEKLFDVAPGAFHPVPKVWSSVVRLKVHSRSDVSVNDEQVLSDVVRAGFAQRRKTILNNLRNAGEPLQTKIKQHGGASIVLCVAGVDLQRRAETLTLEEWTRIANGLD
ncbi:MAG TPA: 16S rRNA (adenine(1518)-N(6)/adenine(1519)-N(6))-dimethyltransferase RsmA [Pyrinomonadaceae bacterium]|jgi:16S rRNA (adenine1518-N6/adenine1519-N6)-dimethyltransferase|nr:16S rRNA (adenine(1518)-N(6)/adenine(1519)-N(6))-dimethyltransferase RsmA [Pyrinomonadaceae bacterium]